MSVWSDVTARLRSLLGRERADQELMEEVEFHLEESAKRYRALGHPGAEARRLAQIDLGRSSQTVEDARDARGVRFVEDFWRDLRHAGRQLRRSPAFASAAVLTLALGVGATTAIFSVVDGVLLSPVPYQAPAELVVGWHTDRNSGTSHEPASWPDYVDLKRRVTTLSAVAGFQGIVGSLSPVDRASGGAGTGAEPVRVSGVGVTHDYFSLLGVVPIAGRLFTADEDRPGNNQVAVIGEGLWRRVHGADPSIVGRAQIRVNDVNLTIVGVVPATADFALDQVHAKADYHATYLADGPVDVWVPLAATEEGYSRDTHPILVLGRLAPGVTIAAAQAEVAGIMADLEATYPRSNVARGSNMESLDQVVFGPIRPVLGMLLAAVALLLVVASVNVANLLLARGAVRAQEVAVRGALGAGAGRLGRQFLVEALLLSALGTLLGVGLANLGLGALAAMVPEGIPRVGEIVINGRVLGATLLVTVVVALGFGMVPTLQARRIDPMAVIAGGRTGGGGRKGARFREGLVIAELALSVCLVVSAGLLARSLWAVLSVDPGFAVDGIVKAEYRLPATRYPFDFSRWPNLPEIQGFNAQVLDRAQSIPGVVGVALAASHPLDRGSASSFRIVGREEESRSFPEIPIRGVSPGYFATMGVPLLGGRLLGAGDDGSAPRVALINGVAAARYFGDRDPIGAEIRFWGQNHRIVGVVGNERFQGLTTDPPPATYLSLAQAPGTGGVLLARVVGDQTAAAEELRRAIRGVDEELAVWGAEPFAETASRSVATRRFAATLIGVFAATTILLALVGIHGVISYATTQRSQEIGIRVALGASRSQVAGLVLGSGLRLAVIGTAAGLVGAAIAAQLLRGFLFGVGQFDALTFVVVPLGMMAAAMVAVLLPAQRAARSQPIDSLRSSA